MHIACVQLDIVWEDKKANYAKVHALIESAAVPKESLVILPEMFATGFSLNVSATAEGEELGCETANFLSGTAKEFGIYLMAGVVTRGPGGKGCNEAVTFDPAGNQISRYQKIHPFTLGGESEHHAPGSNVAVFPCRDFIVSPFVCYDLRFPEVFRAGVRRGAQLFTVIANWPLPREAHWVALLKARAIENQAYVAGVNRAGKDPRYTYFGRSLIIDPHGEVLVDAGKEECVVEAEIQLATLLDYRRDFPALADMRFQV